MRVLSCPCVVLGTPLPCCRHVDGRSGVYCCAVLLLLDVRSILALRTVSACPRKTKNEKMYMAVFVTVRRRFYSFTSSANRHEIISPTAYSIPGTHTTHTAHTGTTYNVQPPIVVSSPTARNNQSSKQATRVLYRQVCDNDNVQRTVKVLVPWYNVQRKHPGMVQRIQHRTT